MDGVVAWQRLYHDGRLHLWWYCSKRYLQYEKIASLWSLSSISICLFVPLIWVEGTLWLLDMGIVGDYFEVCGALL
jgi:hypothetical protein